MSSSVEDFVRTLTTSGLMSAGDVQSFLDSLPAEEKPGDAQQLAQTMFRRRKLTKFQAQAVYQGKTHGLVMGNYVILDRLGKGGMGEVYKAHHRRMDRVVALKVLPAAATKVEAAVKRFQREVKAAARLSHPNIVTAYDADEDRGVHFLVMEYVEGKDLASVIRDEGPMPLGKALDCTVQAARGLEYAHHADVIHRDIKPSNLLIDAKGTVKILDMGLARIEDRAGPDAATMDQGLTQSGEVLGTVDYMPPEQAMNTKDTDSRSDIYSLGATLYFLLTGRAMYSGNSLIERILAHREQPIPSLREARPDVPEALEGLFQRMAAKRREDRPATMTEVLAELEQCAAQGIAASPAPSAAAPAARTAPVETAALSEATRKDMTATLASTPAETALVGRPASAGAAPEKETRSPPAPPSTTPRPQATPRPTAPATFVPPRPARKPTAKAPLESLWVQAVEEAEAAARRRRFNVRAILGVAAKVAVVLGILGGAYYAGSWVLGNSQALKQSEQQILEAVNSALREKRVEPAQAVTFSEGSRLFGVPPRLSFEVAVTVKSRASAARPFGAVKGTLDRATGELQMDIDLMDGTQERGLTSRLAPVP